MSSLATSSEKNPLVSTNVSRAIDDFVDLAIAQATLPAVRERRQSIEGVVVTDGICRSDGFQPDRGASSIGEDETLAAAHLLHDFLCSLSQVEHRHRSRLAHELEV